LGEYGRKKPHQRKRAAESKRCRKVSPADGTASKKTKEVSSGYHPK